MPKNQNKNNLQNQELKMIYKKTGKVDSKNNNKTKEIEPAEKTADTKKVEGDNKTFKNIHTTPAEEQQLENDSSDFESIKK